MSPTPLKTNAELFIVPEESEDKGGGRGQARFRVDPLEAEDNYNGP